MNIDIFFNIPDTVVLRISYLGNDIIREVAFKKPINGIMEHDYNISYVLPEITQKKFIKTDISVQQIATIYFDKILTELLYEI